MIIELTELQKCKTRDVRRLAKWLKIRGRWRMRASRLRCVVDGIVSALRHQDGLLEATRAAHPGAFIARAGGRYVPIISDKNCPSGAMWLITKDCSGPSSVA